MITGLDHIVVLLGDIKAGAKACELVLGRAPSWRSQSDGAETVLFTLDNMTLELMAPAGRTPTAGRSGGAPGPVQRRDQMARRLHPRLQRSHW